MIYPAAAARLVTVARCERPSHIAAALLGLIFLGPGCAFPAGNGGVRYPPYEWGLRNDSSVKVGYDTEVSYVLSNGQTFSCVGGALNPGTGASFDSGRDPIPDAVHVHWVEEESGRVHDADVPVHGHIPDEANFAGTLQLVVTDAGVTLRPVREDWLK